MARLRLFGPAREAAGVSSLALPGADIAAVLATARARFGDEFSRVLSVSRVWLNGEVAELATPVTASDEVAVIPPVSGG